MGLVKLSLFVYLALAMLTHAVLSAPMIDSEDDLDLANALEASWMDSQHFDESPMLADRAKRNFAQWMTGRCHWAGDQDSMARQRDASRRRHRHRGGGRLADA